MRSRRDEPEIRLLTLAARCGRMSARPRRPVRQHGFGGATRDFAFPARPIRRVRGWQRCSWHSRKPRSSRRLSVILERRYHLVEEIREIDGEVGAGVGKRKALRFWPLRGGFSGRLRDAQAEAPLRACRISHRWATASSGLDPPAPRPRCRAIHFCSSSCSKVKWFGSHASMRAERVGSALLPPFPLRASRNPASCNCFANSFAIIDPSRS